jgi:hypothetical protein
VSIVLSSASLVAGDLIEIVVLERKGGVGGSFFIVTVFERVGMMLDNVVWERTGTGGCSFLAILELEESKFDMDFCLMGERGGTCSFGSSFVFVTHQPPNFFSCILTGSILRESIFPDTIVNISFATFIANLLATHTGHGNLVFLPRPPVLASLYLRHDFLHLVQPGLGQVPHIVLSYFMPAFLGSTRERFFVSQLV